MARPLRGTKVGTEHELSLNDREFRPLPANDVIIKELTGSVPNEVSFAGIGLSKELQKHAMELKPLGPHTSLPALEGKLHKGLLALHRRLKGRYRFLGLGMHPLLALDMTTFWDHEEKHLYLEYDRLFGIRQHGWLNIQALQINFPYSGDADMVRKYNRLRSLIPFLVALTAASPVVEGEFTGNMDNRVVHYRRNQARVPQVCNGLIPEMLGTAGDHARHQEGMYAALRALGGDILCHEWVDSRGVIVRGTRKCLELKALDEQESLHADMAVTALVRALLVPRELELEEDRDALLAMLEEAVGKGTAPFRSELQGLLRKAVPRMPKEDLRYVPYLKERMEKGSLAEVLTARDGKEKELRPMLSRLEACLMDNEWHRADRE